MNKKIIIIISILFVICCVKSLTYHKSKLQFNQFEIELTPELKKLIVRKGPGALLIRDGLRSQFNYEFINFNEYINYKEYKIDTNEINNIEKIIDWFICKDSIQYSSCKEIEMLHDTIFNDVNDIIGVQISRNCDSLNQFICQYYIVPKNDKYKIVSCKYFTWKDDNKYKSYFIESIKSIKIKN